jgi:predicted nucleic acid-binding protein
MGYMLLDNWRRLQADQPPIKIAKIVIAIAGNALFNLSERTAFRFADMLRRFSDQDLTLADAVGLHVMRAYKLRSCWSTDHHMRLTGLSLVIDEF